MGPIALLLLAAAALLSYAAAAAAQETTATRCVAAIVSISPCLEHLAVVAPPARAAAAPTDACCAAFLRAVSSGDGGVGCFCHLLRGPLLLGFPIDAERLGALLPTCAATNASAATTVEAAALFADTCRELKSLPEMHFSPYSPPPTPKILPAAVPGSAPATMEEPSTSVPRDRSGSETFSSCRIPLVASVLAAAALIALQL